MPIRRVALALTAVVGLISVLFPAYGATPDEGTLAPSHSVVRWSGGPLNGSAPDPGDCEDGVTCDGFTLTIDVPPSYWQRFPGGVAVRIGWGDANNTLALHVYRGEDEVAGSGNTNQYGADAQQLFLSNPGRGTYRVLVQGFVALNATYSAEARIVQQRLPQAVSQVNTMRFAASTLVDPQLFAPEPSNWVDRDGTVYVAAPWGGPSTSLVWRSDDGGGTFRLLNADLAPNLASPERGPCRESGIGGADAAVASDRTGRVYFADLEAANLLTAFSTDRGRTWTCNHLGASQLDNDRPWLAPAPAADGEGPAIDAYLAYKDFLPVGQLAGGRAVRPMLIHMDVTNDGGKTWSAAATYAERLVAQSGPVFVARDGTVYQVFEGLDESMWIARSTDEGRSFRTFRVSKRLAPPGNIFVSGAVDAAGTVYAAWVDSGSYAVLYSSSMDKGVRWSVPKQVSPAGTIAAMPWVAAGAAGDVAVAWLGAPGRFSRPDHAPEGTQWRPWVARSLNGASSSARFQSVAMSSTPTHVGVLCTWLCRGTPLDYFTIAISPDGAIIGSFTDDAQSAPGPIDGLPEPYVVAARQTWGLGMKRSASASSRPAERIPIDQLDLTSIPAAAWRKDAVEVSFTLSSAADLTRALEATDTVAATDAYWLVVWKAAGRREYAAMHIDQSGAVDFFGGDHPVAVIGPSVFSFNYASYPAQFPLDGSVDPRTGRVTLRLPPVPYHLEPGQALNDLQAFSMTALTQQRTGLTVMDVIDATPARLAVPVPMPAAKVPVAKPPTNVAAGRLAATGVADPTALGALLLVTVLAVTRLRRKV